MLRPKVADVAADFASREIKSLVSFDAIFSISEVSIEDFPYSRLFGDRGSFTTGDPLVTPSLGGLLISLPR